MAHKKRVLTSGNVVRTLFVSEQVLPDVLHNQSGGTLRDAGGDIHNRAMEHNDPRWPPPNWFIAAENSFEPADVWEPKLNRPPVPLSGEGFVIGAPLDAEEPSECDDPGLTHRRRMMTLWARESLRSGQRYFKVARQCAWTDWAIDEAED